MKAIETFMQGKDVFRLDAANHLQAYEYDDLHGRKVISVSPLLSLVKDRVKFVWLKPCSESYIGHCVKVQRIICNLHHWGDKE